MGAESHTIVQMFNRSKCRVAQPYELLPVMIVMHLNIYTRKKKPAALDPACR